MVDKIGIAFWSARCAEQEGASCEKWDWRRAICAREEEEVDEWMLVEAGVESWWW